MVKCGSVKSLSATRKRGLKHSFVSQNGINFGVSYKFIRRGLTMATFGLGLAANTALFTGCPNPSVPGKEPEPIVIPENEFETPNKKMYGDFEMYDFVGTKGNITRYNVDDAASYYTRYVRNSIENKLNNLSETTKNNPLVKQALTNIDNIEYKDSIYEYHNGVEAALAPIFRQMTKCVINNGDVYDETNWKGCCRYMINEAYGYGLGERRTESRPETQKYQEEQKKAKMLVNTNDLAQFSSKRDEATPKMINHYLATIADDMGIPAEDLKKFMDCELYNEALTSNFDLNTTWLGLQNFEHATDVVNVISNPYSQCRTAESADLQR